MTLLSLSFKYTYWGGEDHPEDHIYKIIDPSQHVNQQIDVKIFANQFMNAESLRDSTVIHDLLIYFRPEITVLSYGTFEIMNKIWGADDIKDKNDDILYNYKDTINCLVHKAFKRCPEDSRPCFMNHMRFHHQFVVMSPPNLGEWIRTPNRLSPTDYRKRIRHLKKKAMGGYNPIRDTYPILFVNGFIKDVEVQGVHDFSTCAKQIYSNRVAAAIQRLSCLKCELPYYKTPSHVRFLLRDGCDNEAYSDSDGE